MTAPNMNIDLSQATDIICKACGNYTFTHVFLMKKVSAIMSPTGKETIAPLSTFACNACGSINPEFLPRKEENEEPHTEQKEGRIF